MTARRKIILLAAGAALLLAAAGMTLAAPALVKAGSTYALARALGGRAAADEARLAWSHGRCELINLKAQGALSGHQFELALDTVTLDVSLRGLLTLEPRLDGIELSGGSLALTRTETSAAPPADTIAIAFPIAIARLLIRSVRIDYCDSLGQFPALRGSMLETCEVAAMEPSSGKLPAMRMELAVLAGHTMLQGIPLTDGYRLEASAESISLNAINSDTIRWQALPEFGVRLAAVLPMHHNRDNDPVLALAMVLETLDVNQAGGYRLHLPKQYQLTVGAIRSAGLRLQGSELRLEHLVMAGMEMRQERQAVTTDSIIIGQAHCDLAAAAPLVTIDTLTVNGIVVNSPAARGKLGRATLSGLRLSPATFHFAGNIDLRELRLEQPVAVKIDRINGAIRDADMAAASLAGTIRMAGISIPARAGSPAAPLTAAGVTAQGLAAGPRRLRIDRLAITGVEAAVERQGDSWVLPLPLLTGGGSGSAGMTPSISIGILTVRNARLHCTDQDRAVGTTLLLSTSATNVNYPKGRPATIKAEVAIADAGGMTAGGTVNFAGAQPRDLDAAAEAEAISLPAFNNLLGAYLPLRIGQGTLRLKVASQLSPAGLRGNISVQVDDLAFVMLPAGSVARPLALPVPAELIPFGVSLLTDADGSIHLEIPFASDSEAVKLDLSRVMREAIANSFRTSLLGPFDGLGAIPAGEIVPVLEPVGCAEYSDTAFLREPELASAAEPVRLQRLAEALRKKPRLALVLGAQLSDSETKLFAAPAARQRLAELRVAVVRNILHGLGVAPERLSAAALAPGAQPAVRLELKPLDAVPAATIPEVAWRPRLLLALRGGRDMQLR